MPHTKSHKDLGLGRRPSAIKPPTEASLRRLVGPTTALPPRTYKYWSMSKYKLNQGSLPHCVAYAWLHLLLDSPVTYTDTIKKQGITEAIIKAGATSLYDAAQKVDEWPGEDYDGTSVAAGAKVLIENISPRLGATLVKSVSWGLSLTGILDALLFQGPVVFGSNWYESMFTPDASGLVTISGAVAGGHAYLLNGINMTTRRVRFKNSWGADWGKGGLGYMGFDTLERLLNEQGEAALVIERPHP
jgi:hypothetical protein